MPVPCAVVGCGNFARYIHLPNIKKSPDFTLMTVVDTDIALAERTAQEFGARHYTSDYQAILSDSDVQFVFVCTPHHMHAEQAVQAVSAGKHILVEKPMAMKIEELGQIIRSVRTRGVVFSVGFNRRYSEVTQKAKGLLTGRRYPLLINYRMVNEIIRHPWALDPVAGGGRILSEVVHLFDYCAYMVGAEVTKIYAEGGALTHPEIPDTQDNAVITMRFADGSIAALTVGDLGSPKYPKERIELFPGERTILIDDFRRMETHGFDVNLDFELRSVDKGFERELVELADAVRKGIPAPITEVDGSRATLCAVKAIEAIRTGKAQEIDLPAVLNG